MQENLLPLLCCPVTKTGLKMQVLKWGKQKLDGAYQDVIEEAILFAAGDWFYPVYNGIPRLTVEAFIDYDLFLKSNVDDYIKRKENLLVKYGSIIKRAIKSNKRTKQSFTKEWSVYNYDEDKTWGADDAAMVARFFTETDEYADSLAGKTILDAGCGNGKLETLIAPYCKMVIGMDFADNIDKVNSKNGFANVHFVQGDIHFLPFIEGRFDIVQCSGVLIHTPDAAAAFSAIEPQVKKGGKLSVWLYHSRNDRVHNLFNRIRKLTSKWPLGFQYYLYLFTIFPVSFCIKRLKGNKQNRREMMLNILDWFTPEFRSEHTQEEVAAWFSTKGFVNKKVTTVDTFGFNMIGEK